MELNVIETKLAILMHKLVGDKYLYFLFLRICVCDITTVHCAVCSRVVSKSEIDESEEEQVSSELLWMQLKSRAVN